MRSDSPPAPLPTIDGLTPARLLTPASPQEAADILADATEHGLAVAPVGGATALALGNPPERLDLALSTAALGGVLDYEPTDLVLSVGAGARFADVAAVLAEHGQGLPLDAPGGENATIGGLIATALAGPRRLAHGTLRDLLIGIACAHPSGTVTKAGGMVVKNVTGFDLPRLYHGSLGTLGLIVSANFKVLPLPRAEATLEAPLPNPDEAFAAAARVRASTLRPAALEVVRGAGAWSVAVRLEGRPEAVRAGLADARDLLRADVQETHGPESAAWWRALTDLQTPAHADDQVLVRCAARPRDVPALSARMLAAADDLGAPIADLTASPGVGLVLARYAFPPETGSAETLARLQTHLLAAADHTTILAAPHAWKRGLDIWGRPPETLDVMRALKEQFDPHHVLNPGRFAGGI